MKSNNWRNSLNMKIKWWRLLSYVWKTNETVILLWWNTNKQQAKQNGHFPIVLIVLQLLAIFHQYPFLISQNYIVKMLYTTLIDCGIPKSYTVGYFWLLKMCRNGGLLEPSWLDWWIPQVFLLQWLKFKVSVTNLSEVIAGWIAIKFLGIWSCPGDIRFLANKIAAL